MAEANGPNLSNQLAAAARDSTLNELMGTDSWFIGALGQRVVSHEALHVTIRRDHDAEHALIQRESSQRWGDHGAVHESDKAALSKALEQADKALLAALEAHRREHLIQDQAQTKADETHQTQHRALNELRTVVGDLTTKYAPIETITSLTSNWDRRWDERQKEEATYRTQTQTEEQLYRTQVRSDLASLRESRSEGSGSRSRDERAQIQNNWLVGIMVVLVIGAIQIGLHFIK